MIFNWIYGTELEMEAVTKTYSDITEYSIFHLPLTVSPLAVILRTSAGDDAELCTYYRADQNGDFTLRVSQGSCPVSSRMRNWKKPLCSPVAAVPPPYRPH